MAADRYEDDRGITLLRGISGESVAAMTNRDIPLAGSQALDVLPDTVRRLWASNHPGDRWAPRGPSALKARNPA